MEKMMTAAILVAALWAVACRINQMKHKVTKDSVFFQYAALAFGLFGGLVLPVSYALPSVSGGVLVFLLIGTGRWKHGAPRGVLRQPEPLEPIHWGPVHGGKDS